MKSVGESARLMRSTASMLCVGLRCAYRSTIIKLAQPLSPGFGPSSSPLRGPGMNGRNCRMKGRVNAPRWTDLRAPRALHGGLPPLPFPAAEARLMAVRPATFGPETDSREGIDTTLVT